MSWTRDVGSRLRALDRSRGALVRFGLTMGTALLVLGAAAFLFGKHPARAIGLGAVGVGFLLIAGAAPGRLKPVQTGWMAFAFALGWVVSRVLLTVFFFAVLTPVGLVIRISGKNPLHASAVDGSYWVRRQTGGRGPSDYERMF